MNLAAVKNLKFGHFVEIKKNVFANTENINHIYRNNNDSATIYLKNHSVENTDIPYDVFINNINQSPKHSDFSSDFFEINSRETIHSNEILTISKDSDNTMIETIEGTNHYSNQNLSQFILNCSKKLKTQFINMQGKNISNLLMNFGVEEYNKNDEK